MECTIYYYMYNIQVLEIYKWENFKYVDKTDNLLCSLKWNLWEYNVIFNDVKVDLASTKA